MGAASLWLFSIVLLMCLAMQCGDKVQVDEGEVAVTYQDKKLYKHEIAYRIPANSSVVDSQYFAEKYVDDWLKSQAVAEQAHKLIPDLDKQVKPRVNDFELKMISYLYSNYVLRNQLDSSFSDQKINAFYQKHTDKFVNQNTLYAFFYVRTKEKNPYQAEGLMRGKTADKIKELQAWGDTLAVEYKLDSSYVSETELNRVLEGSFLKPYHLRTGATRHFRNKIEGVSYYHFFKLLDKIEKDEQLPIKLCQARIHNILLSQRKEQLVAQRKAQLLNKAKSAGKIK